MADPQIQYATTSDGMRIAYYAIGSGPPLVMMPSLPVSHLLMEWQLPGARERMGLLSQRRTLIRYDPRGFGLSDRGVSDFSVERLVLDLEAVADHLRLGTFQLLGGSLPVPIAIAYAARNPGRVSHLVIDTLSPGYLISEEDLAGIMSLADTNWELTSETLAHVVAGWSQSEVARQIAAILRECTTPQSLKQFLLYAREWNVDDLLPRVTAPTLVIAHSDVPESAAEARRLASAISGARLVVVDAAQADTAGFAATWSFISEGEAFAPAARELPHTTVVMLLTDIVESTSLTEELGDAAFRDRARDLDASIRSIVRETGGTPVEGKVLGDGVLAVFASARAAIEAAIRCESAVRGTGLELHIGIHAGDVIRDGDNVYGGAVNIAARITGASRPGEILVSDVVRGLARTSAGAAFDDRGEHTLKGIAEPQHLYAVHLGSPAAK